MFQRPIYQTSIALLTLAAVIGGLWVLLAPEGPPGVEITQPAAGHPPDRDLPAAGEAQAGDLVDINNASASELQALPGIGPVLSERIVADREANGRFERIDQLMAVTGIGPATFERISPAVFAGADTGGE